MSLHHSIACESSAARLLRRCAPLLLVVGLTAVALAPGLIAGDGPFQQSLCHDHEPHDACARLWSIAGAEPGEVR
jgi:hypothetical protein